MGVTHLFSFMVRKMVKFCDVAFAFIAYGRAMVSLVL